MKHAFTPCRECKALTQNANGLCDAHQHAGWERHQQRRDDRGGFRYDAAWRKQRHQVLFRDEHCCQECKRQGINRIATEIDHIVPIEHGGSRSLDNLQALCRQCHKHKTARERLSRTHYR